MTAQTYFGGSHLPKPYITLEEYLEIDRKGEVKSEYYDGEMYQMAGASLEHNTIVGNVISEFHSQLKNHSAIVLPGNMRLRIPETRRYAYPDVTVVCSKPEFDTKEKDVLLNPTILVEVLSDSTEARDRGEKASSYRRIASLQEYIFINQDKAKVETYSRKADGTWVLSEVSGLNGVVKIASLKCQIAMAEIYDKVALPQNVFEIVSQPQMQKRGKSRKRTKKD